MMNVTTVSISKTGGMLCFKSNPYRSLHHGCLVNKSGGHAINVATSPTNRQNPR